MQLCDILPLFDSVLLALLISFSQVNYIVTEAVGMVNVCVVFNVISSRDIVITLSDVAGTASPGKRSPRLDTGGVYIKGLDLLLVCLIFAGSDYVESSVPSSVTVFAGRKQACFDLQIIDDDLNELQEGFQITARLPGTTTPDATAGILINDNDGRTFFLVTLCVQKPLSVAR